MVQKSQVVLSGIRATGKMHLGNFLGAMMNFVKLQEEDHRCFYFVADWHTLTTHPDPEILRTNPLEIVMDYLAAGINPEKSTLYLQSSVPEIAELTILLSMVQPVGELLRCPTYKEKIRKHPDNINHGLLTYPVLMAADILGPKATLVPVGEDQLPHLEMAQSLVRRFNRRYGKVFVVPKPLKEKAIRVPGLDGTEKMGKSEGNTIDLMDSPQIIKEKVRVAVTDPKRQYRNDPGRPEKCNIFTLHELMGGKDLKELSSACRSARIGCIDCKERLSGKIIELLFPFQEEREKIAGKKHFVEEVLRVGGRKARSIIGETLEEARNAMGLKRY